MSCPEARGLAAKAIITVLGMEHKAATESGFVLFVRAVLFPSILPHQAALSVSKCPEALVIFPGCFTQLLSKKKKKKERNGATAACWAKGFLPIID